MGFEEYTSEELDKNDLLPEGVYDFEIVKAEDRESKSGNEMIALSLRVYGSGGESHFVNDYLVAIPNMKWKMKQIVEATGIEAPISSDKLQGRAGKVSIKITPAGEFPAKNEVKGYGTQKEKVGQSAEQVNQKATAIIHEDDDIPFN